MSIESGREIDLASCLSLYGSIEQSDTPVSDFGWLSSLMKHHDIKWTELDQGKSDEEIKKTFRERFQSAVTRVAGIGEFDIAACQAVEERCFQTEKRNELQLRYLGKRYIAEHSSPAQ